MVIMVLSIFTATSFLISFSNNESVSAVCNDTNNKNIYCHEQYNTHSNIAVTNATTTTTSTTATTMTEEEEEKEPSSLFCMDLKCNLSDNDLLDSEVDTISSPLGDLEY